jgi:hypothetical protein
MTTRVLHKLIRSSVLLKECSTSQKIFVSAPIMRSTFVPCIQIAQQRKYTRHGREKVGLAELFAEELKKQLRENKQIQEDVKSIKDSTTVNVTKSIVDSAAQLAEKASPHIKSAGEVLAKGGEVLVDSASKVINSEPVTKMTEAVTKLTGRVAQQQVIKYVIDDLTEEFREQRTLYYNFRSEYGRKQDLKNGIQYNPYTQAFEKIEDVAAKANTAEMGIVIAHKKQKEKGIVRKGIDNVINTLDGSNNILVKTTKSIFEVAGTISDTFVEKILKPSEESQVLTIFKENDPTFSLQRFMKNIEFIIIPEVLGAYFNDDVETLHRYVSDNCYRASFLPRIKARQHEKSHFDTKILDTRDLSLLAARFHGDEPMLTFGCHVQYIYHIKDEKGNTIEGGPNDIRLETHYWTFRQDSTGETKDWEIVEAEFGFDTVKIV